MTTPGSSDRWTFCSLGHVHWGAHGGAGLLLRHVPRSGEPVYLLAERSRWVDEGGTWGMPGGAIHDGESPEAAAHREANEEIWPVPPYRLTGIEVQDCGGLRHALATELLSRGVRLPEIAQVLRQRDLGTTAIYAKVDYSALRELALPWLVA